ncbi:MAG: rhomboid family intramembrane serine protease [Pseudomonadota bacterium]
MDLNRLALWFAAPTAISFFVRSVRAKRPRLDWMLVSGFVLLVAGVGWFEFQSSVGFVAMALVLVLIMLPSWAGNAASRASKRAEYARARWFARLAALLHPRRDWRQMAVLYQAFGLAHEGRAAEADALLQVLASGGGSAGAIARAHRLRMLGRWREIKALVERSGGSALGDDPTLLAIYVRALAELGYIDELAEFMLANEALLTANAALDVGLLSLFAFTGQLDLTRQMLAITGQGDETRDYWLATALQYAGQPSEARWAFGKLREAKDAQIRARAQERFTSLTHTEPEPPLTTPTRAIIEHFAQGLADKQNLALNGPTQRAKRRITQALVLANVAIYVFGSAPPLWTDTRPEFGSRWAFFAPRIFAGEWWRTFSYMFVHAGALHLLMNMACLWVLGPFVERAFGRLRFCLIYFISGAAGSVVYLALSALGWIEPEELVGASGCIMGLLGATAGVMLRAWIRQRAAAAREIFLRLLSVVGLQVVFDYTTPQVAGLAHALGLAGGFASALVFHEIVSPKRSVARTGSI